MTTRRSVYSMSAYYSAVGQRSRRRVLGVLGVLVFFFSLPLLNQVTYEFPIQMSVQTWSASSLLDSDWCTRMMPAIRICRATSASRPHIRSSVDQGSYAPAIHIYYLGHSYYNDVPYSHGSTIGISTGDYDPARGSDRR